MDEPIVILLADDTGVELSQTVTIYLYHYILFIYRHRGKTCIMAKGMEYFLHFIKDIVNIYIYIIKYIFQEI